MSSSTRPLTNIRSISPSGRCGLCQSKFDERDDPNATVCVDCRKHPDAQKSQIAARAFTPADKALIRQLRAHLASSQLLSILNDRLVADLGAKAPLYTMQQLHAELGNVGASSQVGDWAGLRSLLARERKSGLLVEVTPERIDDFAIAFSLTPAQLLRLNDVLTSSIESDETEARHG